MKKMDGLADSDLNYHKMKNPIYIVYCKAAEDDEGDDEGYDDDDE
jgi:hypothetical protein